MEMMTIPGEPPPELAEYLRSQLRSGETLLWTGYPEPRAFVRAHGGLRIFGVFFGGFALLWMTLAFVIIRSGNAQGNNVNYTFPLFALPFLLVGIFLSVGVGVIARRKAARSVYGLTAQRAIVIEGSGVSQQKHVFSYDAAALGAMSKVVRPDGSGDLVFEQVNAGYQSNRRTVYKPRGFLGIPDVDLIESKLCHALLVARASAEASQ